MVPGAPTGRVESIGRIFSSLPDSTLAMPVCIMIQACRGRRQKHRANRAQDISEETENRIDQALEVPFQGKERNHDQRGVIESVHAQPDETIGGDDGCERQKQENGGGASDIGADDFGASHIPGHGYPFPSSDQLQLVANRKAPWLGNSSAVRVPYG